MPSKKVTAKVEINGKYYPMIPDFKAQDNIEAALDKSIFQLLTDLQDQNHLRIRTLATIIHFGIASAVGDHALSIEEVGDYISEVKVSSVVQPVADFLQSCIMTEDQIESVRKGVDVKEAEKLGNGE